MEQAPASKDDKALTPPLKDNETPTPATKSGLDPMKILENLSDYLTKEQIEQIRKNMPTLQLEGMGNIEKSNSEIPLGNYTN